MRTLRGIQFERLLNELKNGKPTDEPNNERLGNFSVVKQGKNEGQNLAEENSVAEIKLEETKEKTSKPKPKEEISQTVVTNEGQIKKETPEKDKNKELSYQEVLLKVAQELPNKPYKLREVVGQMIGAGDEWQKIPEVIDNCPDISELREKVLNILEKLGYVEQKPEGYVVDLEKIKTLNYRKQIYPYLPNKYTCPKKQRSNYQQAKYFDYGKKDTILFYAFKGLPLISKKDYKQKKFVAKELFYIPDNPTAALEIKKIKQHPDFHLGRWEIGARTAPEIPTANGEDVNAFESRLACIIYHPHFGDGQRNKNGELIVKYKNGERKKISYKFLKEYQLDSYGLRDETGFSNSPYAFLISPHAKKIVENNILKPKDFSLSHKAEYYPHKIQSINSNGYISMHDANGDTIRYYVGKGEFSKPNYAALNIGTNLGVVINKNNEGAWRLSHIFNLTNPEDGRLIKNISNKGALIRTAQKNITQTRKYNPEQIEDKNQLKELQNFEKLLEKINIIKQISGIDVLTRMETKEAWQNIKQALLETQKSNEEIGQFIKKYGLDNLLIFLESNISADEFDKYINLGEKLEEQVAKKIFNKFSEIVELSRQSDEELSSKFFHKDSARTISATAEILERGKKLVSEYSKKLAEAIIEDKKTLYVELLKHLDEVKQDIIFFTAMFKTAYQDKEEIDFNEIKDTKYEHLPSKQIKAEDAELMEKIYMENYQNYPPEFRQKLLVSFKKSLNNPASNYDILRYQNKIVAFLRFDNLGQENGKFKKHFAAFNLDQHFSRGRLGEAMLKLALEREKKNSIIIAECDPQAPVAKKYFELGFKKIKEFDFAGVPSLQIELRD